MSVRDIVQVWQDARVKVVMAARGRLVECSHRLDMWLRVI